MVVLFTIYAMNTVNMNRRMRIIFLTLSILVILTLLLTGILYTIYFSDMILIPKEEYQELKFIEGLVDKDSLINKAGPEV